MKLIREYKCELCNKRIKAGKYIKFNVKFNLYICKTCNDKIERNIK